MLIDMKLCIIFSQSLSTFGHTVFEIYDRVHFCVFKRFKRPFILALLFEEVDNEFHLNVIDKFHKLSKSFIQILNERMNGEMNQ